MKRLINKTEEIKIRADWEKWNREAHPEDQITFMDYLGEIEAELEDEDEEDDDWFDDEDEWYE